MAALGQQGSARAVDPLALFMSFYSVPDSNKQVSSTVAATVQLYDYII